jgi:O-antigen ligase
MITQYQPPLPWRRILALLPIGLLIGLLPWTWILGGVLIIVPLVHPILGLGLLVLSVTAQDALHVPGGLTLTQCAVPLAAMGWAVWVLAHPQRVLGLGRTSAAWGLFLMVLLLATSLSGYGPAEGLKELWRWCVAFLAWLIAVTSMRRPWHFVVVVVCLLAGPLANALLGLVQFVTGDGPRAFRMVADLPYMRAYGTLGQPNSFAVYLNMAWPLGLALALATTWVAVRRLITTNPQAEAVRQGDNAPLAEWLLFVAALVLWMVTGILLAALVASFSRGAWLGAAIGVLGMLLALGGRSARVGLVVAGLALLLLLGGTQFLPAPMATRLTSITSAVQLFDPSTVAVTPANFAVVERMAQLWAGWKMFLAHPLLGVGPGNYTAAYQEFTAGPWFASRGHAHNYYLQIAAEAGLLGLAAYLILLGSVVRTLYQGYSHTSAPMRRAILIGICGIIAATAGHGLFEHVYVLHMTIQAATVWGLGVALVRSSEGT